MNLAEAFQDAFARGLDVRPRLALEPTAPICTPYIPLAGRAGSDAAIAAALAGDSQQVDQLEVWWLNTWGPRPDVARFTKSSRKELLAMAVHRSFGARAQSAIEWGIVTPCQRCWRKVVPDNRCRFCGGRGHVSDDWDLVYTDMEFNELEAA